MKRLLLLLPVAVLLAACGDDAEPVVAAQPDPDQRYRVASATVLESTEHGPQLCLGGVAESYPPQCGGLDLVGWDWADVPQAETASGTTWAAVSVIGTYDGEVFTVAEVGAPEPFTGDDHDFAPICDDFDADATESVFDADLSGIDGIAGVWVSDPSGDDWDGPFVVNVIATPGNGDSVRAAVAERWTGALCVEERDQPTEADLAAIQAQLTEDGVPFEVSSSGTDVLRGVVYADVVLADAAAIDYAAERWGDAVELRGLLVPVP